MSNRKKIGIISDIYAFPIFQRLLEKPDIFEIIADSPAQISKMLREGNLDAAFLSPISYARDHNLYSIIPNISISSEGGSGIISLFFKEGSKKINTIATDLLNVSEMVLAKIIMIEKYSTTPQFIPATGNFEEMLNKADAVLIVGDSNLELKNQKNKLDLVDEWFDITEMSYVHGIWVQKKEALTKEEIKILDESAKYGSSHLTEIASSFPKLPAEEILEYLTSFSYQFDKKEKESLFEFIRMAYYYNIIDDLPDFQFDQNDSLGLSLN